MSQQQRSPDESPAARSLDEAQAESGDTPLESGMAPRTDGSKADPEPEGDSLYDRLLRSGALDEVMEVAAREQAQRLDPAELGGVVSSGERPNSEVVPAGTTEQTLDLEVDLEALEDDEASEIGPARLPANAPPPPLPSMMLGPDAATRPGAATERLVLKDLGAVRRPSLTPQAHRPGRKQREERAPMLALVALLCLTAGALVFWFATRPEPTAPQAAAPQAAAPQAAAPQAAAVPNAVEPAPASVEAAPAVADAPARQAPAAPPAEPAAVPEPTSARRRAAREPAGAAPTPAEPTLPEQPDRAEVVQVMQDLTPTLQGCVGGAHGDVRLRMTVLGSGRVTHAVVEGAFEGTPEGSCLARAVREARLPEFGSRFVRLTYPVRL